MSESLIPLITSRDEAALTGLLSRVHETEEWIGQAVEEILADIRTRGLPAVLERTLQFDKADLTAESFRVSEEEMEEAFRLADPQVVQWLKEAEGNIRRYHEKQKWTSWFDSREGILTGQLVRPLSRVGCYVPGGTASYPSSVLMTVVPASVAGVSEIVVISPPGPDGKLNPYTLVAARLAGATGVWKAGGAQAVGALAYGAGDLLPVDKIVGPGNIFVTVAKKQVYGQVDIDMLAGPSEILVVADDSAEASYVAADLLSQAEHDPLSSAVLITQSLDLAVEVREQLRSQLEKLSRQETARQSLRDHSALVVTESLEESLSLANRFAPEHLELCVRDPFSLLDEVKNAGAVFLGHYTPEPVGDYWAGPNHVLPTSGTARFYSPLNLDTYMKKISLVSMSREALLRDGHKIAGLADSEGLTAHAASVRIRLEKEDAENGKSQ